MPALPNVRGLVKVELEGLHSGKAWANVMHMQLALPSGDLGVSQADLNTIATGFSTAYGTNFATNLTTAGQLSSVTATDLTDQFGLVAVDATSRLGTIAGTSAPPEAAFLINWKIARRYRGGHPRTYLSGPVSADVSNDGNVVQARRTSLDNAIAQFLTDVNSLVYVNATAGALSTVHYFKNGTLQPTPDVDAVLSGKTNLIIGVQRRRLRRS